MVCNHRHTIYTHTACSQAKTLSHTHHPQPTVFLWLSNSSSCEYAAAKPECQRRAEKVEKDYIELETHRHVWYVTFDVRRRRSCRHRSMFCLPLCCLPVPSAKRSENGVFPCGKHMHSRSRAITWSINFVLDGVDRICTTSFTPWNSVASVWLHFEHICVCIWCVQWRWVNLTECHHKWLEEK